MGDILEEIKYDGGYQAGRFDGHGTYECAAGRYVGQFHDGQFHGKGTLYLNEGGKFVGEFRAGKYISGTYIFEDGLEYKDQDWEYCTAKDPRFYAEVKEKVPIDGPLKYVTSNPAEPLLPLDCYDVIDGYYDPSTGCVRDYITHSEIRRPDPKTLRWIMKKCRVSK
eukprot:gene12218-25649_t